MGALASLGRGRTSCLACEVEKVNRTKLKKSLDTALSEIKERFAGHLTYVSGYTGLKNECVFNCQTHGKFKREMQYALASRFPCPKCRWDQTAVETDVKRRRRWVSAAAEYLDRYEFSEYDGGAAWQCRCLKHGITSTVSPTNATIRQLLDHGFNGSCPECARETRSTRQQKSQAVFKRDLQARHGNDVQLVGQYAGAKSQATFECKHGHVWQASAESLVRTKFSGCPRCAGTVSVGETQLFNWVLKYFPDAQRSVRRVYSERFDRIMEWDIFIPSLDVAIEYNGMYWHSYPGKHRLYHWEKSKVSRESGVRLLHIYETDWKARPRLVKSTILHLLGKTVGRTYARSLRLVSADKMNNTVRSFYERTHMLGAPTSGTSYALVDHASKVKAVMTFAGIQSERGVPGAPGSYELVRFSTSGHVVGAASRLWTAFLRTQAPTRVVSYSDNDLFDGRLYAILGFESVGEVAPEYKTLWDGRLRHKSYTRRQNLQKLLGAEFDPALSEMKNLLNNNKIVIYDSGKTKWEWLAPATTQ